jgi:hypothetical protein
MKKIIILLILVWAGSNIYAQENVKIGTKKSTNMVSVSHNKPVKTQQTPEQRQKYFETKKTKYLKWNTNEFRNTNQIPQSFPKYIDNNNPQNDVRNFEKSVKMWIETHKEEYKNIKSIIGI